MLFKQRVLEGIARGDITLAFRRWRRPTVRTGGSLLTPAGVLEIESVDRVDLETIGDAEARSAGCADVDAVREALSQGNGEIYRIALRLAGPDPRTALREAVPTEEAELVSIRERLQRWDRSSPVGEWTVSALRLIERRPEARAGDLADDIGMDRDRFKTHVRKLKGLGMTESLGVGYRLSPRGAAYLAWESGAERPEPGSP